jgi:hypothetical protein
MIRRMSETTVHSDPNRTHEPQTSLLPTYLAHRDEPCPSCGYNLRALKTDRCPECNQQLVLRVGLAEPRMAAFITGVVGLAMGLGFSVILAVFIAIDRLTNNYSTGIEWQEFWPMVIGSMVLGVALWCWLHWRGAIRRASAGIRCTLAALCFLASGVTAYVIFAVLSSR